MDIRFGVADPLVASHIRLCGTDPFSFSWLLTFDYAGLTRFRDDPETEISSASVNSDTCPLFRRRPQADIRLCGTDQFSFSLFTELFATVNWLMLLAMVNWPIL